jgi:CO/xanthine dehydrogenase Mo-binding subunit
MTYAVECQMTRLADATGIDPIFFRRCNLRRPGSPGYLGQKIAPSDRLVEMLDAVSNSDLWQKPRILTANKRLAVGTGFSLCIKETASARSFPTPGLGA